MAKVNKGLERIEFYPGEKGGGTFKHHMKVKRSKSPAFYEREESKEFPFGPGQHEEALAHFADHSGLDGGGSPSENSPDHEEGEKNEGME